MSNPTKKSLKAKKPAVPVEKITPPPAAPEGPKVAGALPGQDGEDFYWEERVALWLGIPRKRVRALRRRALAEGTHWAVREQEIVYTVQGIQQLRDLLRSMGVSTKADRKPEPEPEEPKAPAGPPTRGKAKVVRIYPNPRLMLVTIEGDEKNKPVTCKVRENLNFMPGMVLDVVKDPRAEMWQHVGRLPRRRGRW